MKVLFLSQIVPYPPHGGVLQRGYNLLRELGREARVHLLAFVHPDELQSEEAREQSRRALLEFCETVQFFELWPKRSGVHTLAALGAAALSARPFSVIAHRSGEVQRSVREWLRQHPFDILHVDTVALSQFVPPETRVPRVLTHHNIESLLMLRRAQFEKRRLARAFLQREARKLAAYEALVCPQFDVNIVMSVPDGEALVKAVPDARTAVVPNGVDTDYFAPQDGDQSQTLIYTGGMNMFANRDAVLHFVEFVWPMIQSRAPDVRFLAVGQDPPDELRALAARDPRIVVTGYVDDVRPYINGAAVYVVPLRVGGGTRLKVLDAMAMGKAMVSTSIGCEGIDVTAGEHLLIADQPKAFADATLKLLADDRRRALLGRAARGLVMRRYSWRLIGEQLRDAYAVAARARSGMAMAPRPFTAA
jgi:polysaccharide biosynthesis protein PslH